MALYRQAMMSTARLYQSVVPYMSNASKQFISSDNTNLKDHIASLIPKQQQIIKDFRAKHKNTVIGDVTVDMIYGGMRGILSLVTETSVLDPEEGIRFRGYSIPECQKLLPKAPGGNEPLPEAIFWLLVTGNIPTQAQVAAISKEWAERAELPSHVVTMLKSLPSKLHPMTQFSAAIIACNTESHFVKAYTDGVNKSQYWEHAYEDAMDMIAKLPIIAATIYRNLYRDGSYVGDVDATKDWSANFAAILGYDDPIFSELMRLYFTILSDHEGGNVCAHTCHLVGSALSNCYLSFGAGICGLAGPLHGLANQEVLLFLSQQKKAIGTDSWKEDQLKDYILAILNSGQVVPGYGHAVLRKTDPRHICQREFAQKHLPDDLMFKLASDNSKLIPEILMERGKVKNPWPNVDALSGVLLQFYGMTEMHYYTVLLGLSRALGCMASMIWDRALGLPIERPKSISTEKLIAMVKNKKIKAT